MIKIDKDIPLPVANAAKWKYPWSELEVGESFFVPDVNGTNLNAPLSQKVQRKKFARRKVDGGYRVWRVA